MPEKQRRHFLKDKESKALLIKASGKLRINLESIFGNKASFEVVEAESERMFLMNGKPLLAESGENLFPTLVFNEFSAVAPKVVVDMGAVPYVCKGANVMVPGIRRFEGEFKKGDLVVVIDEKYGKPIAIGEALYDSEEARKIKQGIVIKNIHFVSDKTWNLTKELETKV
jgi:PUA domain protein